MVYHRRPGEEGAIVTLAGKYTGMRALHQAAGMVTPSTPNALQEPFWEPHLSTLRTGGFAGTEVVEGLGQQGCGLGLGHQ